MFPFSSRIANAFTLAALLACSSGGDDTTGPPDPQDPDTPSPEQPTPPEQPSPAGPSSTIAYVRGGEIRGIEPDGSGDRSLFTVPQVELGYTVSSLAWRPDGAELAFASDHEAATSFFERDLYVVRADGQALRKLTNGPAHDRLAGLPKGAVTVRVENLTADAGPWFIYVAGASEPQQATVSAGGAQTLTFPDVADLGDVAQPAVVINGTDRWFGDAQADVRAGATADAGTLLITAFGGVAHYGADGVAWRADGGRVAFFAAPTCTLKQVPSTGTEPLQWGAELLDLEVFGSPCAYDWGPTTAFADQIIIADDADYSTSGETHIYRVSESDVARPAPLTTFDDYVRVVDLRWLPDGSGFMVARTTSLLDESVNLYEFQFATGELHQITSFGESYARRFSISPDGQQIVFERVTALDGPSDLWIIGRDGTGERLLVRGGGIPGWRPGS